jgi:2-polyprenyl-3-methyl-5-hydroxy-6-metoxy-1,4-benzoquinol methylase
MINLVNSKHDKYKSKNPISQYLVQGFFSKLGELYNFTDYNNILDVGCGEGLVLGYLNSNYQVNKTFAIDYDEKEVLSAKKNIPFCNVNKGNIYDLQFDSNEFDLVICSEVLEHLIKPEEAIAEIHRVTKKFALLSVPREPIWRILNMIRFKYWKGLGNTPDHLNHWSKNTFKLFIKNYFKVIEIKTPLPWTIILCEKK